MNVHEVRCSPGENLEILYKQVFDEIYDEIKTQNIGVLSTVIYTILGQKNSQAKQICEDLKIYGNKELKDDLSLSLDIIGLFVNNPNDKNQLPIDINKFGKNFVKKTRKNVGTKLESKEMQLYQIVLIGCLIVGVLACIAYLNSQRQKKLKLELEKGEPTQQPKPKILQPATLCLVVPASMVKNIKKDDSIHVSQIEELIDSTLYFLCTTPENADKIKQLLELTNEEISNVSEQTEVYVRIKISDGEKIIGKEVPFIIKRNLPDNQDFVVTELACLKYLSNSGLENFNRV